MTRKPSTPRVRRFRQKMIERGYSRFEATIDAASIEKLRLVAYERNMPIWEALERAIDLLASDSGSTAS